MAIHIVTGDLLDQSVDVIVNAWNRNVIPWWLLWPQGVSGAIKKKAGYQPFLELGKKGILPLGGAVVTGAGKLPFRAIIHVAGINLLWVATETSIRRSVLNALTIAEQQQYASIAFPLIGAGTGGFSADRVLDLMLDEGRRSAYSGMITLVKFKQSTSNR